ncbi:Protein of unknown function [Bacillus cytotoxicus]|uniref:Uncharacterized protein n=1 Tax=Bacillus cytotoxicus TaxID=580165 RepID=A0AAX2CIH6_9BACI|nr:Protein of unknown function [Bacillus cytotoxicus]SCN38778.1 Protein of unknown function [Bacillus cytotoxicus]
MKEQLLILDKLKKGSGAKNITLVQ